MTDHDEQAHALYVARCRARDAARALAFLSLILEERELTIGELPADLRAMAAAIADAPISADTDLRGADDGIRRPLPAGELLPRVPARTVAGTPRIA